MSSKSVNRKLQKYVRRYFAAHPEVKLVAVTGSVGKTSTKEAIATVLSQQFSVRMHEDADMDATNVPLAVLGIKPPKNPHGLFAWSGVYRAARARIKNPADAQIIVQELGADAPGDMEVYSRYLRPYIAVVTSVTPENMQAFRSLEAVATEQLSIGNFSEMVLINRYDISGEYAQFENNPNLTTYGSSELAEYSVDLVDIAEDGRISGELMAPEVPQPIPVNTQLVGEHKLRNLAAAAAVGLRFGMAPQAVVAGLEKVAPMPGRLNPLPGIDGTIILDDSDSASPASTVAALQALYLFEEKPQLIAVLGGMDGLGDASKTQHEEIAKLCNPSKLSWLITVGDDANRYLAPVAKLRGNQVKMCANAIEAAEAVRAVTETGAVILVKGSRDGLYLEETVKDLCDLSAFDQLVRQSDQWRELKRQFFESMQK